MIDIKDIPDENNVDRRYLTMFKNYDDILEVKVVCEIMQVDKKTIYTRVRTGELKSLRFGRTVRIPKIWLIEYIITLGEVIASHTREQCQNELLKFCSEPRRRTEMMAHVGYRDKGHFTKFIMKPLLEKGLLVMTYPSIPNHVNQKYKSLQGSEVQHDTSESLQ